MKVGLFPLWIGSQEKVGGIATYDNELIPALAEAAPEDEFEVFAGRGAAGHLAAKMQKLSKFF